MSFYVTAILFVCCYIIKWAKFGSVFGKQTSVAACKFQNQYNKVENALRVVQLLPLCGRRRRVIL